MLKTKAAFKAVRESCGLSQQDVADEAGVDVRSVKRWEKPDHPSQPPDDVWEFLQSAYKALQLDARCAADEIAMTYNEHEGGEVRIDYYRMQEDLDAVQLPDADEPVGYANARARLIGEYLEPHGIPYTFVYRTS